MDDEIYTRIKEGIVLLLKEGIQNCGQYYFDVPNTNNIAAIAIEKSAITKGLFILRVCVSRKGSGYWTGYFWKGQQTEEALKKYLEKEVDIGALQKAIKELSDSVDDKAGEFPLDY